MADRTVRVVLTGNTSPYNTAMRNAARNTQRAAAQMRASMASASRQARSDWQRASRQAQASMRAWGTSAQAASRRAQASMRSWATSAQAASRSAQRAVDDFNRRAQARMHALGTATRTALHGALGPGLSARLASAQARVSRAATRIGARWAAMTASMSSAWGTVTAGAGTAAGAVSARWGAAASWISGRWAVTTAGLSSGWGVVTGAASTAATRVSVRWTSAASWVAGRWGATTAALASGWGVVTGAAGSAAAAVSARWAAAVAAVRASMTGMAAAVTLAGAAAGAAMLSTANTAQRSLRGVRTASIGLVAAFGLAVFAAARFEHAMASVKAVSGANVAQFNKLRAAAMEAGRTTAFSATQAAEAELELAKAGVTVADIVGGALKGTLNLAAAAQMDLAEAAEISANAMTVFGLKGKDVEHVADVLAAAANKSTTDVHDLGMSLRMAGQVAAQTGLSLEDTVGTLALFAYEGQKGSDAGTSFKVMLQRLTPQSKEAQRTMDKLGLSAYDAQGNFIGLEALAGNMKQAFSNLTPEARNAAMGVIFGSDAVRAANIIYKHGAEGIRTWTKAVDDNGYAAAVAAVKMDSLVGDLQLLKSAIESALIESGSAANGVLRQMAKWVTSLVNVYSSLPPGVQQAVTLLAGFAGVLGLVGAGVLLLLPRLLLVRRELVALGLTAARVRGAMMGLTKLGAVVGVLAAVGYGISKLQESATDAPPSIDKMGDSLIDFANTGKATGELAKVFGKDLDGFGESLKRIAHPSASDRFVHAMDAIMSAGMATAPELAEARQEIDALDKSLAGLVTAGAADLAADNFEHFADLANKSGTSTEKFRDLLPGYTDALAAASGQEKINAQTQGKLGDETAMTNEEMADQRTEAEKLADILNLLNGAAISAAEAEIGFRESLNSLSDSVKENGTSLDINTEAGLNNKSAFLEAAKSAQKHAETVAEQTNSVAVGGAVLEKDIGILKRRMKQLGFTDGQIKKLIGTYAQLPAAKSTKVSTPGVDKAISGVDALYKEVKGLQPGKTIVIKAPTSDAIAALKATGYNVKAIPGSKNVKVTAPTGTAQANAKALKAALDRLRDKYLKIVTNRYNNTYSTTFIRTLYSPGFRAGLSKQADGGIVRGYANGGMRERHVAQIAQPTWRMWAEPETGGEAYIPMGLSKRGRSTTILEEVAKRFGYRLEQMAGGGILSARTMPASQADALIRGLTTNRAWRLSGGSAAQQPSVVNHYHINPRTLDMTVQDLELLQRRQEALVRVGRPR